MSFPRATTDLRRALGSLNRSHMVCTHRRAQAAGEEAARGRVLLASRLRIDRPKSPDSGPRQHGVRARRIRTERGLAGQVCLGSAVAQSTAEIALGAPHHRQQLGLMPAATPWSRPKFSSRRASTTPTLMTWAASAATCSTCPPRWGAAPPAPAPSARPAAPGCTRRAPQPPPTLPQPWPARHTAQSTHQSSMCWPQTSSSRAPRIRLACTQNLVRIGALLAGLVGPRPGPAHRAGRHPTAAGRAQPQRPAHGGRGESAGALRAAGRARGGGGAWLRRERNTHAAPCRLSLQTEQYLNNRSLFDMTARQYVRDHAQKSSSGAAAAAAASSAAAAPRAQAPAGPSAGGSSAPEGDKPALSEPPGQPAAPDKENQTPAAAATGVSDSHAGAERQHKRLRLGLH